MLNRTSVMESPIVGTLMVFVAINRGEVGLKMARRERRAPCPKTRCDRSIRNIIYRLIALVILKDDS